MGALIEELALAVNWDNKERFVQLVRQAKSRAQSGLISNGHVIASRRLSAQTNKVGWLNEQWSGLSQYEYLSQLLEEIEGGGWEIVAARLKSLQACIFNQAATEVLNITADSERIDVMQVALQQLAERLPASAANDPVMLLPSLRRTAEGIIVPSQVNYVGKGANLYASGYVFHGSALVISKFLGTTYLWDHIRVSGGAYGGFCQFDPRSGDFKYLSYRDPNLAQSWKTYDGAPQFLKEIALEEDELSKAIIGCMGDIDAYMLPDAKGYQAMLRYLLDEDVEYRQKVRDEVLSTTVEDFRGFAKSLDAVAEAGGLCVVGSKEAIDAAKDEFELLVTSPFSTDKA